MRQIPITAIMEDGTTPEDGSPPLEPFAQQIQIPQWTDCQINGTAYGTDGNLFDIEGGALILSAKRNPNQADPDLSFEATIVDGLNGTFTVVIGSNDTGALNISSYGWMLVYIDADGKTWPVVASGRLGVVFSEYVPGQLVTVPSSQEPLAQGPVGLVWLGLWDVDTTYETRDGVQYADPNGGGTALSSFVALDPAPVLGVPPLDGGGLLNAGWDYLAERGAKGDTGAVGPPVPLSDDTPAALGTAGPGAGTEASRWDHVHPTEIPDQTGNADKVLGTNGTSLSWVAKGEDSALVYWPIGGSWTDVYAEIVARGGHATVYLDIDYSTPKTITAGGPYDLTFVTFFTPQGAAAQSSSGARIIAEPGVTLTTAILRLSGVWFDAQGELVPANQDMYLFVENGGAFFSSTGAVPFPSVADFSALVIQDGSIFTYGGPIITTGSGRELDLTMTGALSTIGAGSIGGAGLVYKSFIDPMASNGLGALAGTATYSSAYGAFPIQLASSAQFTPANVSAKIAFQPSSKRVVVSDGNNWGYVGGYAPTAVKTANYVAVDGDLVRCNPTGAGFSVTLPAATAYKSIKIKVQADSANPVTLLPNGSDTIDGQGSLVIAASRASVTIDSDGVSDGMVS